MQKIIHYRADLKVIAKTLRKKSTLSEIILWSYLKGKKMKGYKFVRQKPIENYIIDFFCPELLLAIEIDGLSHGEKIDRDDKRQKDLENIGINFLRFNDRDVKSNINEVLKRISDYIDDHENKILI